MPCPLDASAEFPLLQIHVQHRFSTGVGGQNRVGGEGDGAKLVSRSNQRLALLLGMDPGRAFPMLGTGLIRLHLITRKGSLV